MNSIQIGVDLAKSVFEVAVSAAPGRAQQTGQKSPALAGRAELFPKIMGREPGIQDPRRIAAAVCVLLLPLICTGGLLLVIKHGKRWEPLRPPVVANDAQPKISFPPE